MAHHAIPADAELRRIRSAVETGEEPLDAIGRRFNRSRKTIVAYIARYGWTNPWIARQKRDKGLAGGMGIKRRIKANGFLLNPAKYIAEKRREVEGMDRRLYGPLLEDVQFLRRRGWAINIERGGFLLGNKVVGAEELVATAARERRLTMPGGA